MSSSLDTGVDSFIVVKQTSPPRFGNSECQSVQQQGQPSLARSVLQGFCLWHKEIEPEKRWNERLGGKQQPFLVKKAIKASYLLVTIFPPKSNQN